MSDEYMLTDADAPAEDGVAHLGLGDAASGPAHDRLAEQSAVGSMMLDPTVIDDVTDELSPSDFYLPAHEVIARAIASLHARNLPTDVIAVADELTKIGKLREAGGAQYLHELTSVPSTAANAGYMAGIVAKLAGMRRLTDAGTRINAMGRASEGELPELLESARLELDAVAKGRGRSVRPIGDTLDEVISGLETKPTYLRSPWEALDRLIGGFAPGRFYVVAARPGQGKSIASLQIAIRLAHEGMVAFSSLEMSEEELQKRMISQFGLVSMTALRDHTLSPDDWRRIAEARVEMRDAAIYLDTTAAVSLAQIRAHARSVARKGKLSAVIVDYLQLVSGEGTDRRLVVDAISRGLKQLAKDLEVPVIAAAQLKRGGGRKSSELPTLEDLRESGAIEQDADCVILLHRDEKKPYDLQMVVAKNRHGSAGKFTLSWQAHHSRLQNRTWSPTALIEESEIA